MQGDAALSFRDRRLLIAGTFILNAGLNFVLGLALAAVLGPAEYGRFAVAAMVAVVLGTAGFDWLRLSATRFYTEAGRTGDPALRSTLEAGWWGAALAILAGAGLCGTLRFGAGLSGLALAATAVLAVANGRFDLSTALCRARFLERPHAVLMMGRNALAFALSVVAGLMFKDAAAVLAALAVSAMLALLPARAALRDPGTSLRHPDIARLGAFARYGVPIVAANVVYQLIVLLNRSVGAAWFGYGDAGRLSLATDMSIRLLLVVGAALDVSLFQIAVRRDAAEGRAAAHAQLRRNMVLVTAVLVLLAVGYAGTMPAFAALVVPAKYRDAFGPLSLVLLPGILAFCLVNFALNPVFQLEGRTAPVVAAAVVALAADGLGLAVAGSRAGLLGVAMIHSASLIAAGVLAAGLAWRSAPCRPPARDMAGILLAAAAASLAIWPTRWIGQPIATLACAAVAGTGVYVAVLVLLDVGSLQDTCRSTLARLGRGGRFRLAAAPDA